jgi:peroxiredoxin
MPRHPHTINQETSMAIKVGDKLPSGTLYEFIEDETPGCTVGPNAFEVADQTKGKRIAIFGLPGAFTPTCSAKHLPGYVEKADQLKAKGIDEIWCFSVNDAFVMGAWGREQHAKGKVRMMGDGSGTYTKALGLELDLVARGLGTRCQRFSMLVVDGVVKTLNIEEPGKYDVSSADKMMEQVEKGSYFLP